MPNLLIEIGVEELPVASLDVIYEELAAKTRQKLVDERIAFAEVKVEATPRRIALYVQGIAAMQPDRELEIQVLPVRSATGRTESRRRCS